MLSFVASAICEEPQEKTMQEKVAEYYIKTKQALWNHRYKILAVTSVVAFAGLAYWYRATIAAFLGYDVVKATEIKQDVSKDDAPKAVSPKRTVSTMKAVQAESLNINPDVATPASEVLAPVSAPSEKAEDSLGDVVPELSAPTTLQSVATQVPARVQDAAGAEASELRGAVLLPEETFVESNSPSIEKAELEQIPSSEGTTSVPSVETVPLFQSNPSENNLQPMVEAAPMHTQSTATVESDDQPASIAETPVAPVPTPEQLSTEPLISATPKESTGNNAPASIEQQAVSNNDLSEVPVESNDDSSKNELQGEELQQTPAPTDEVLDVNWKDHENGVNEYVVKYAKRLNAVIDEQVTAETLP